MSRYTMTALMNLMSSLIFGGAAYLFFSLGGAYVPLAWISVLTSMIWLVQCVLNLRRRGGKKK